MSNQGSGPPIRLVMRMLLAFMVSAFPALARRHGGDVVRGVIFLAIAQANRPRFADIVRYGVTNAALKPVSVNSLAASLGMPYETARRHVLALARTGLVVRAEGQGALVPHTVITSAAFDGFAVEIYAGFRRMLRDLRAIGFDFDGFSQTAPDERSAPDDGEQPDAAVRHVIVDFLLRMVECGREAHDNDMIRALVFTGIMSANAAPYTMDRRAAWNYATLAQSPPEAERLPVSVSQLARGLSMPYETVRRYVEAMIADEDIVRVSGRGVINPQVSPRDPKLHQSGALIMSRFVQLIGDLKRLGYSFDTFDIASRKKAA